MKTTEMEFQQKVVLPLEQAAKGFRDYRDKFTAFQLQLITIAAATFSIYVAFGKTTATNLTKWGFIFLAGSLVFGLLSVMLNFFHGFFSSFWQIFDVEKFIFKSQESAEIKDLLSEAGYSEPAAYDERMDEDLLDGVKKSGVRITRKLMESSMNSVGGYFAGLQLAGILIATVLLLIGLLQLPVS